MIDALDIFKAFQEHRGNAIVMTSGTSGRRWREVSTNPKRDPVFGGALSKVVSSALGLALAQPDVKVVLFDSEGALLMNLGSLVTIAGKQPKNFYHFLLDNECYATTGGQPVPNSEGTSYSTMAEGAGYAKTYDFDNLEDFATSVEGILEEEGPVFVSMKVIPDIQNEPIGRRVRAPRRDPKEVIQSLREDLGVTGN